MVGMRLYVEGGGDAHILKVSCRKGFSEFLKKAGLGGHMPRIVACGSRMNAYRDFCIALTHGEPAMLLVDSEDPVITTSPPWQPWQHLLNRPGDKWQPPAGSDDNHCHLMVQCMEAWFLADRQKLETFFGQGFNARVLPEITNSIEGISRSEIYRSLADATRNCKTKAAYGKGEHSFKLLALIDPAKVTSLSGWAKRFIDEIERQMQQVTI